MLFSAANHCRAIGGDIEFAAGCLRLNEEKYLNFRRQINALTIRK